MADCHVSWPHTRRDQRSVHSNAHPTGLSKFPDPTTGDMAPLRDATTRRRHRQGGGLPGVFSPPGGWPPEMRPTWRRATAGSDLRVFSRRMPYSRARPALTVPYFFAAGCPRRVCRNPHSVCGLFWTLLPVLTCTVQPVGHFHQHVQT